ncbi:MAG: methylenetetrahydrofolate--tRNA-(uracil(54)-C(5))-methyltransferase (FADH(2)-oxidizing) TrmFO [Firmicutes bacterium]|nr:methylenetetrahydrofolate--tRNA-(uracil(54)-C(5))-methyltransferase (FADH(2)-oxidizing) TrmFO [Bacillota bacterium]
MKPAADLAVIGGGLAGVEAAWQAAQRGYRVAVLEMRPQLMTPAHRTADLAELVCSNSLRSNQLTNAVGLLKEEMRRLGSLVMDWAERTAVPAGAALAVDREAFAAGITAALASHPMVEIVRREVTELPGDPGDLAHGAGVCVLASGPLTSELLAASLAEFTGIEHLYFYDAVAPVVEAETIDRSRVFPASRYEKGDPEGYLNCPLSREEYDAFYEALVGAEAHPRRSFDKAIFFEGCLPVEEIARRGRHALRFGSMKPVGLVDPGTGRRPWAVVQLRPENTLKTLYNLVGFQTNLKWGEQRRVFSLIPGLEKAAFARYGVMHRNTFIDSPRLLKATLQFRGRDKVLAGGQLTGVEGYVESAATGLVAGLNGARILAGLSPLVFPAATAVGSLCAHVSGGGADKTGGAGAADGAQGTGRLRRVAFQPMNANYGLLPPLENLVRDRRERNLYLSERALKALDDFIKDHVLDLAPVTWRR